MFLSDIISDNTNVKQHVEMNRIQQDAIGQQLGYGTEIFIFSSWQEKIALL